MSWPLLVPRVVRSEAGPGDLVTWQLPQNRKLHDLLNRDGSAHYEVLGESARPHHGEEKEGGTG